MVHTHLQVRNSCHLQNEQGEPHCVPHPGEEMLEQIIVDMLMTGLDVHDKSCPSVI